MIWGEARSFLRRVDIKTGGSRKSVCLVEKRQILRRNQLYYYTPPACHRLFLFKLVVSVAKA